MGFFDHGRQEGFPTRYPEKKTPVTVDVLETGLILAFVIVGVAFLIIILGSSIKRRTLNSAVKVICSLAIGGCLMVGNFGQEWEVGRVYSRVPYRAGSPDQINATIGIKLGLRSVNVTLKGNGNPNTSLEHEIINYNERFAWTWDQGRFGFGPYAGLLQRSFREAQLKGLPIPILSIMEYFVVDGEGLRFGRFYRTAGWYTHILMWTAFATWILANVFLITVGRYAAYYLALTGALQILSCIVWNCVRNPYPLVIPFEDGRITTSYGTNYWMALICGVICLLLAAIIIVMDLRFPDQLASFLGLDPIADYDEFVLMQSEIEAMNPKNSRRTPYHMEMQNVAERETTGNKTLTVLKRRSSATKAQKSLFRLPLPTPLPINESSDDFPIYENHTHRPAGDVMQQGNMSDSSQVLCPPLPQKKKKQSRKF